MYLGTTCSFVLMFSLINVAWFYCYCSKFCFSCFWLVGTSPISTSQLIYRKPNFSLVGGFGYTYDIYFDWPVSCFQYSLLHMIASGKELNVIGLNFNKKASGWYCHDEELCHDHNSQCASASYSRIGLLRSYWTYPILSVEIINLLWIKLKKENCTRVRSSCFR